VTPVLRLQDLAQAIRAGGDVGQDEDGFWTTLFAGTDLEPVVANCIKDTRFEAVNRCAHRFLFFDPQQELQEHVADAFHLDDDALC
jgi:uncharacterized protein YjaZ